MRDDRPNDDLEYRGHDDDDEREKAKGDDNGFDGDNPDEGN